MTRQVTMLLSLLLFGMTTSLAHSQSQLAIPDKWTAAVLFRTESAKRIYVSTTYRPNITAPLPLPKDPRIPMGYLPVNGTYDYEVWLMCGGNTQAVAYRSQTGKFALLYSTQAATSSRWTTDTGRSLQNLMRHTKPADVIAPPKKPAVSFQDGPGPPSSLSGIAKYSHLVFSGRVVGVLSNLYSPINARGA
ncbi:MAG: hypothetical protein NT023_03295 [Armatimonadetes bacterium]|nr:hypothetical protein [Armatimonadota bacterium]